MESVNDYKRWIAEKLEESIKNIGGAIDESIGNIWIILSSNTF